MRFRWTCASLCALVSFSLGADFDPAAIGPGDQGKLFLRAGTVESAALPNLLIDRPVAFEKNRAYVLQLRGPITPEQRAALSQAGVTLGSYLPGSAYLAELDRATPEALAAVPFIQWVGEYQNAWKLDPMIGHRLVPFQTLERIQLAQMGKLKLSVTLFQGVNPADVVPNLEQRGAEILQVHWIGDEAVVEFVLNAAALAGLAELPAVQFVEEAPELTLRNGTTRWIVQTNISGLTPLYTSGIRGAGQIVGIMDGKINISHCSFFDSDPVGPLHRKVQAYNTTLGSDTHGTHVAGTAVGDNFVDDNTRGIAYEGRLVYNTIPTFSEPAIISRLNLHHSQGGRIHTNSWGNDGTTAYDGLCRGIDVFSWDNEEDLVLFAVTNLSTLKNPENAKNLLAVAASRDTPQQHMHCTGGSGPTSDGRRKPEIYAPGCSTNSSYNATSCGTTTMTGTSMASPAVAGVGMLVRQYYADGFYPAGSANPGTTFTPSGALIKATLLNSAVDMTGIAGYPSNLEGWGRVLIGDALYLDGDTRILRVLADKRNAEGLSTGEVDTYNLNISGSTERLKVTLVWTDFAAGAGAAFAAVNNLDLEVIAPGGTLYLGNVFSGGVSVTGGESDIRNNVEQVHLDSPSLGNWTLRVIGTAVNQSTQGYALVATGEVEVGPTCLDGIQNQGEDLIDCGGPCPPCGCLVDEDCNDGAYCNGVETCVNVGRCLPGEGPCTDPKLPVCDEETDTCVECLFAHHCDDEDDCTVDACNDTSRTCGHTQLVILYGDLDDTGSVDVDDLGCMVAGYAVQDDCPDGDIFPCGGDGRIDVDDLLAIVMTFGGLGPCPDPCPPGR